MGIIWQIRQKIKSFVALLDRNDIYTMVVIILVGTASFGLGRLSTKEDIQKPVEIKQAMFSDTNKAFGVGDTSGTASVINAGGELVGSKNGTKYHFPWCSGAKRMKEENKVWFKNKEEAERAGYTPAANCKGL